MVIICWWLLLRYFIRSCTAVIFLIVYLLAVLFFKNKFPVSVLGWGGSEIWTYLMLSRQVLDLSHSTTQMFVLKIVSHYKDQINIALILHCFSNFDIYQLVMIICKYNNVSLVIPLISLSLCHWASNLALILVSFFWVGQGFELRASTLAV
jgi:hypothetical protein